MEKEMEKDVVTQRVRMNFTTNAKGLAQMDITVEFPTVEESKDAMDKAIVALKEILAKNKIVEAGTV